MSTCKLCLKSGKKMAKSHVISRFEYEKNGLIGGKIIDLYKLRNGNTKSAAKKNQIGIYDLKLLCTDCEPIMNQRYENSSSNVLYETEKDNRYKREQFEDPIAGKLTRISGVDYHSFKGYLMLNLWRSAVSKRPFFEGVNMSKDESERIRRSLYLNESFEEDDYVISTHVVHDSSYRSAIIAPLTVSKHLHILVNGRVIHLYHRNPEVAYPGSTASTPKKTGSLAIQLLSAEDAKQTLGGLVPELRLI